jgi:hypothetical protein
MAQHQGQDAWGKAAPFPTLPGRSKATIGFLEMISALSASSSGIFRSRSAEDEENTRLRLFKKEKKP